MRQFALMTEAFKWLVSHQATECSVVVHGDPYHWVKDYDSERMVLHRQYYTGFYLRPFPSAFNARVS